MAEPWEDELPEDDGDDTATTKSTKPNKHRDRFAQINAFAWSVMRDLSRSEGFVWLSLWTHTNAKTGLVQISQSSLIEEVGCSIRQVAYTLASLEEKGLLTVKKKGNNLTHEPSVYKLKLP